MNYSRALGAGFIFYIVLSLLAIILMEFAGLDWSEGAFHIFMAILSIPIVLASAKWHFKNDSPPTPGKGAMLGLVAIIVSIVADLLLRVPNQTAGSVAAFFADWRLLAEYILIFLLFTYAGFEFDDTYTSESKE
ncbi:hypothetical protein H6758_00385 [Candidatus Nomurabacteria bacterium]|nr:hypothetical protein [Candidatus Nomurabacteria bacterium]